MKSLVVVGLSVAMLSLGLFVPEGHAGKHTKQQVLALKAFKKQQLLAFKELKKELKAEYKSDLKELKQQKKEGGLTKAEYKSLVKATKIQYLTDLKAFKTSSAQQVAAFINNGYTKGTGGNSVPVPGTLLLFAGGFAGVIHWRARQPAA